MNTVNTRVKWKGLHTTNSVVSWVGRWVGLSTCSREANGLTAIISVASRVGVVNGWAYRQQWARLVPWQLSVLPLELRDKHAWDVHARQRLACGSYQPAFSTGRRVVQSPLKWWSHLSIFNSDRATSGRVNGQEWVRDLQRAAPMEHPEPSHVVGSIAKRLTRPVNGNLSEWSGTTWALLRTGAPQELWPVVIF